MGHDSGELPPGTQGRDNPHDGFCSRNSLALRRSSSWMAMRNLRHVILVDVRHVVYHLGVDDQRAKLLIYRAIISVLCYCDSLTNIVTLKIVNTSHKDITVFSIAIKGNLRRWAC
jgi:hypothetical protein